MPNERLSHAKRAKGHRQKASAATAEPRKGANREAKMSAKARLVIGPTTAIAASSAGACGTCCIWDRPPMGMSRISSTTAPRRRATKQWPSSCTSTEPKTATVHSRPSQNWETSSLPKATKGTRSRKVQWTRMSIPKMRAIRTEPLAPFVFDISRSFSIVRMLRRRKLPRPCRDLLGSACTWSSSAG